MILSPSIQAQKRKFDAEGQEESLRKKALLEQERKQNAQAEADYNDYQMNQEVIDAYWIKGGWSRRNQDQWWQKLGEWKNSKAKTKSKATPQPKQPNITTPQQ